MVLVEFSHGKQIWNWENSYKNRDTRKSFMQPDRAGKKKKKSIKSEPILGGICKEEKFYTSRPSPWRVIRSSHNLGIIVPQSCAKELPLSCLLENALRQMEELQKPRLCSQGMCLYWLAENQGGEGPAPAAATSPYFLIWWGKHPGSTHFTP